MITIHKDTSTWGGSLVLTREFFEPETGSFIWIEAHECKGLPDVPDGHFLTAIWTMEGNEGSSDIPTELHELVEWLGKYTPPAGFKEMTIPYEKI